MDVPQGLHGAYLQRHLIARCGRYRVRAAVKSGEFRRIWHRVLVEADRAAEVHTRAAAAVMLLGPRAIITGPTAAWLHGCRAIASRDIHVLVPYRHPIRRQAGLAIHNGSIPPDDMTEIDGLPVFDTIRVTSDLLCTARARDAIAVTDQMLAAQPPERREAFRERVAQRLRSRPDPRGTRRGARLLGLATGRAESPAESWLLLEVVDMGFPPPDVNWSLLSPAGVEVYRLDLAWPDQRIALEYNGYAAHVGREAEDERRTEDLRRRGWEVITVTSDDLRDNQRLARELANAFARQGYRPSVC